MFIIVGILVAIVIGLLIYNVQIHRKIQEFNSLQRQANNLRVLQDFLSTIGETSSVDDKIKKINDILIEKYEIKYSTIVVYEKLYNIAPKMSSEIGKSADRFYFLGYWQLKKRVV